MISCPSILLPSLSTSIRRAREARALATAVASSVLGNNPIISHLLSPVCTHSSYCFHLAIDNSVSHIAVWLSLSSHRGAEISFPDRLGPRPAPFFRGLGWNRLIIRYPSPAGMSRCCFRACIHAFPAGFFALVLLVEPLLERRKVVQDRRGVHLPLAADGLQCVRPGLAFAHA